MEQRTSERITIGFDAEIIYNGKCYSGVIENLSENGVNVITTPTMTTIDFIPDEILVIKFQTLLGDTLILHCKVKWSYKTLPHGLTNRIGMEIIDPPWDKSDYFL